MTEQPPSPHFIIWRVVEPDRSVGEPGRCKTVDGLLSWNRGADESADDFEKRINADATATGRQKLIMFPRGADDIAMMEEKAR